MGICCCKKTCIHLQQPLSLRYSMKPSVRVISYFLCKFCRRVGSVSCVSIPRSIRAFNSVSINPASTARSRLPAELTSCARMSPTVCSSFERKFFAAFRAIKQCSLTIAFASSLYKFVLFIIRSKVYPAFEDTLNLYLRSSPGSFLFYV